MVLLIVEVAKPHRRSQAGDDARERIKAAKTYAAGLPSRGCFPWGLNDRVGGGIRHTAAVIFVIDPVQTRSRQRYQAGRFAGIPAARAP